MSTIQVPIPALRESLRKKKEEEKEDNNDDECVIPSPSDPCDLELKDQREEGGSKLIASEIVNVTSGNIQEPIRPGGDDGNPFPDDSEEERVQENEVKINETNCNEDHKKTQEINGNERNDNNVYEGQNVPRDLKNSSIDGFVDEEEILEGNLEQDEKDLKEEIQVTAPVPTVINDGKNEINVPEPVTRTAETSNFTSNRIPSDEVSAENTEKSIDKSENTIKPVLPVDQKTKSGKFYPTDLNPFGDEDEGSDEARIDESNNETIEHKINYPGDLNPFGDEPEDGSSAIEKLPGKNDYDKSKNPFGDDDDEVDISQVNPIPKPRRKNRPSPGRPASEIVQSKLLKSSRVAPPVPTSKPIIRPNQAPPRPPQSDSVRKSLNGSIKSSEGPFDATASPIMASRSRPPVSPRSSTPKRKPPAPMPPSSGTSSLAQSPVPERNTSSLSTRASTPSSSPSPSNGIAGNSNVSKQQPSLPGTPKSDRSNLDRRSSFTSSAGSSSVRSGSFISCASDTNDERSKTLTPSDVDKKVVARPVKRQAPAPPTATRRTVVGSIETIQADLNNIGDRLAEIQIQMKHLEESFSNNPEYGEELVYNYLELLKETCFLARKQEELMYQKREHKLEQEHADIEFEIRDIEIKPHFKRTPDDDERVQQLLLRLIEVIDERNDVVENMTRINKRPDFDRGVDKLRKMTSIQIIEKILPKFMEENDISVIETKIIPCNNIFHVSPPTKETEEEKKARKREEKEKKKQEKKEKREMKKAAKKEAKDREEMEKFTQRLSIDGGDRDSKVGSETTSIGGDSFKKDKKVKNPLKAIKKLSSTLSRSSSSKLQTSSPVRNCSTTQGQQAKSIPVRSPLPDFQASSVDEENSESTTQDDSQKNSESHLI